MKRFDGNFTQQEPIPAAGIARAVEVMRGGRLHRYNMVDGETPEVNAHPTSPSVTHPDSLDAEADSAATHGPSERPARK